MNDIIEMGFDLILPLARRIRGAGMLGGNTGGGEELAYHLTRCRFSGRYDWLRRGFSTRAPPLIK
jgi:hypothetical protein